MVGVVGVEPTLSGFFGCGNNRDGGANITNVSVPNKSGPSAIGVHARTPNHST